MPGVGVFGNITPEEVVAALKAQFPSRELQTFANIDDTNELPASSKGIFVCVNMYNTKEFRKIIEGKDKHMQELESSAAKSLAALRTLQQQQQEMYGEFEQLHQRYSERNTALQNALWVHCAENHPDLTALPPIESDDFEENENKVGNYMLGSVLGDGQFATVKNCFNIGDPNKALAIKIIKKERIFNFNALKRVAHEVEILQNLSNPNIVRIEVVMHTQSKLYLVTEKGGKDLFEFFDEHPDGVPEKWAMEITSQIMAAVFYCHYNNVCHRDLKPENILLIYDTMNERCLDLKLCDFGLSTVFDSKTYLTDFCGSPGFFAPEMLVRGSYFGDKADIWSVGCILLELVLGHERFCDLWMIAYDYSLLQEKNSFGPEILKVVDSLKKTLEFSTNLNEFILGCLKIRSSERMDTVSACRHAWFEGRLDEDMVLVVNSPGSKYRKDDTVDNEQMKLIFTNISSPSASLETRNRRDTSSMSYYSGPSSVENLTPRTQKLQLSKHLEALENMSMDERVRHKMAENEHEFTLPPIEAPTPNMSKARKLLTRGEELTKKTESQIMHKDSKDQYHLNQSLSPLNPSMKGKGAPATYYQMSSEVSTPVLHQKHEHHYSVFSPVEENAELEAAEQDERSSGGPSTMPARGSKGREGEVGDGVKEVLESASGKLASSDQSNRLGSNSTGKIYNNQPLNVITVGTSMDSADAAKRKLVFSQSEKGLT